MERSVQERLPDETQQAIRTLIYQELQQRGSDYASLLAWGVALRLFDHATEGASFSAALLQHARESPDAFEGSARAGHMLLSLAAVTIEDLITTMVQPSTRDALASNRLTIRDGQLVCEPA